jgi:hypothetical protein
MTRPLDEATKRELAVKASCDPRTIDKEFRGEHVRGLAGQRARRALLEAGLLARLPQLDERGEPLLAGTLADIRRPMNGRAE